MKLIKYPLLTLLVLSFRIGYSQMPYTIQVSDLYPPRNISPTLWGIFFEDINFAADGGLYAELVKNRSFEFDDPWMGWTILDREGKGSHLMINNQKNKTNPRYVKIKVDSNAYGLVNEGFRGMGFRQNENYIFTCKARSVSGNHTIKIQLLNYSNQVIGENKITMDSKEWKMYKLNCTASDTAYRGKLKVMIEGKGDIHIDMISLFPQHTWKERPGGLRADLAQALADIHPGFIRFPGGCIVEGRTLSNRYQWKKTVGTIENRTTIMNRWNTEFKHKLTPDYFQSFGLGFYEYFLLADDLGAEPLPILNCGMACQFNTAEVASMDELDPYIQDAMDLIEFANGAVTTRWGKLRAEMGHAQPFNLKYIGVGNEQWEDQYFERYKVFEQKILAKYPKMRIVSGVGPFAEGEWFNEGWQELKQLHPYQVDEHYYKNPNWFFENAMRYDPYPRSGPKIFAGEYAAHVRDTVLFQAKNTWLSALAEGSFMTGLERNADIINMASYAPLFAHKEAWQWRPDLIWFDNVSVVKTPNYHIQKLYANNKGHRVMNTLHEGNVMAGQDSLYASAVMDTMAHEVIIKISNHKSTNQFVKINLPPNGYTDAQILFIKQDLNQFNEFEMTDKFEPSMRSSAVANNQLGLEIDSNAFYVIRLKNNK